MQKIAALALSERSALTFGRLTSPEKLFPGLAGTDTGLRRGFLETDNLVLLLANLVIHVGITYAYRVDYI